VLQPSQPYLNDKSRVQPGSEIPAGHMTLLWAAIGLQRRPCWSVQIGGSGAPGRGCGRPARVVVSPTPAAYGSVGASPESLGIVGPERYLCAVSWLAPLTGFLGGVVGAALAGIVAWRTNSSRMAADIQARWDAALLERGTDFVTAARSLRHHAERFGRSADKDARRARLDEEQEQLRELSEQLRLVGSRRVQVAARRVVHHAYAVRVEGEEGRDPRGEEYPEQKPVGRLNDALQEFHCAVREQLRAPDPEDVVHDDDLASGLEPLPMSKRSSRA
jgi:hypothetical protein